MPVQTSDQAVRAMRQLSEKWHESTRAIGKIFELSSASVSYWLRARHLPSDTAKPGAKVSKQRLQHIKRRRAKVSSLVKASTRRNGYVVPKYESATAIRAALAPSGFKVSKQTVLRDLRALGFVARVRPRVPVVAEEYYKRRLAWCRRHRSLQARDVVFTDEKYFVATGCGTRLCWVQRSRQHLDRTPIEKTGYPDKLMVWGAIGVGYRYLVLAKGTFNGGTVTYTAHGGKRVHPKRAGEKSMTIDAKWYKRRCLQPVVPYLVAAKKTLMQDGAASHVAKRTLDYLENKGVPVLDWPARSPDLNPIERLWAILCKRVATHFPRTLDDLTAAVLREFEDVPQDTIDRLVLGHDARRREVERLRGQF